MISTSGPGADGKKSLKKSTLFAFSKEYNRQRKRKSSGSKEEDKENMDCFHIVGKYLEKQKYPSPYATKLRLFMLLQNAKSALLFSCETWNATQACTKELKLSLTSS